MKYPADGIFKRNEGFRLLFKEPLVGTMSIKSIQGIGVESNTGAIQIIDMSLKGMKIISELQLPVATEILLKFMILDQPFRLRGELIWRKDRQQSCMYGVEFEPHSYSEKELLDALKKYVVVNK
ncbi:PilZ domain-containing protein [Alkalihalobacillus sp. 1P02AB]|uniref:PilZ domain-containing protein n=1 Tax=Alkalihalobacillus sp. 1P02AB TaxID=3132260 RepID=UPI0039A6C08E